MLGELYGQCYSATMGLEVVSLRFFNVYGPRQNPAGGYAAAIPVFIDRFLRGKPPLIHGDGQQTRDFIFVGDVADACLKAADAAGAAGQSINVGTGVETSVLDIVDGIREVLGSDLGFDFGPTRAGDIPRSVGSVERMSTILGASAVIPLSEGLRQTIAWYQGEQ
jgi:UDP-N-acetylglucosamine 4-epimerase